MSSFSLKRSTRFPGRRGPLVIAVMDGVGCGLKDEFDAVHLARTPTLDRLWATAPHARLRAHGTAVGMPSDADMGNSEVGHNALGAGRIYDQGAKLVARAIREGTLFQGETWNALIQHCLSTGGALHFVGLLSDGNVHSHIEHLFAMLREASRRGVKRLRVHALLDGRDVPDGAALRYVEATEKVLAETGGVIASPFSSPG